MYIMIWTKDNSEPKSIDCLGQYFLASFRTTCEIPMCTYIVAKGWKSNNYIDVLITYLRSPPDSEHSSRGHRRYRSHVNLLHTKTT